MPTSRNHLSSRRRPISIQVKASSWAMRLVTTIDQGIRQGGRVSSIDGRR